MRIIPAAVLAKIRAGTPTIAWGVRIVRRDGTVLGWTEHDVSVTILVDGQPTYLVANPGFSMRSMVSTSGLGVDNTEVTVGEGDDITRIDILDGKWDGSEVHFFRYDWELPEEGIFYRKSGSFGNFRPRLAHFVVEFRDKRQALQHNATWVIQEACRWRFGDSRCKKVLSENTFSGVITAVASTRSFTASGLTHADDWFGEGEVIITSGPSLGMRIKVRTFAEGGVVTLSEPAHRGFEVGNTFDIITGCRHRWDVDCRDKHNNLLNYGGEKDKPLKDTLVSQGTPTEVAPADPDDPEDPPTGGSVPNHFGGDEWFWTSGAVSFYGQRGDQQTNAKSWSPYSISALSSLPANSSGADGTNNIRAVADPADSTKAALLIRLQADDADTGGSGNSRTMVRFLGDSFSTPPWPLRGGSAVDKLTLPLYQPISFAWSVYVSAEYHDYCDVTEPGMVNVTAQIHDNSLGTLSPNVEIVLCGSTATTYGKPSGNVGFAMAVRGNPGTPPYSGSGAGSGGTTTPLGEVLAVTPGSWHHFLMRVTLNHDAGGSPSPSTELWTATGAGAFTKVVDSAAINAFQSDASGYGASYDHYFTFGQYIFDASLLNAGAVLDLYFKPVVVSNPGHVLNVSGVQAIIQAQ